MVSINAPPHTEACFCFKLSGYGEKVITWKNKTRKKKWLGHILRHNSLVKLIIQIKVAGNRVGGKRSIAILDDVENGVSYALLKAPKIDASEGTSWLYLEGSASQQNIIIIIIIGLM